MAAGVGKSGSPAPKPITGSPAAFIALALASMASVAEGATAVILAEMRAMPAMLADVAHPPAIVLPDSLRPADGRFGCGPSKVRPEALAGLAERATDWMGTSHRQK